MSTQPQQDRAANGAAHDDTVRDDTARDDTARDDTARDVTRLILDDHDTFRRAFADLDDLQGAGADAVALAAAWAPLAALLDVHAVAEERIFYPHLLRKGSDEAEEETLDAVGDHNDIRDAVHAAARQGAGSAPWWSAVAAARVANTEHMAEEEDEALADFRRNTDPGLRAELGQQFLDFKAAHPDPSTLDTSDQNPARYVAEHTGPADGSLGIGSLR